MHLEEQRIVGRCQAVALAKTAQRRGCSRIRQEREQGPATCQRGECNFQKAVAAVGALGPESTVSEFTKAQKDQEEAYKKLTKAAFRLSEAQDAAFRKVKDSFEKTVSDIKGSEKLGAAATTVQQATAQALSQYSDIASTTCVYGGT